MKSMSRATWTDERLDDFARHTDQRFDAVDQRFDEVDRRFDDIDQRFDAVNANIRELRSEMHAMRTSMETRFDSLQRGMFQAAVTLLAALLTVGGAIVATQL
jgi:hypothetical protein